MPDAVPPFGKAMLRVLGGKDATREGSVDAYRALVNASRDGRFDHFREQRIFYDVYFDSTDDLMSWMASDNGPLSEEEFKAVPQNTADEMRKFASALKHGQTWKVRDILIVSSALKHPSLVAAEKGRYESSTQKLARGAPWSPRVAAGGIV